MKPTQFRKLRFDAQDIDQVLAEALVSAPIPLVWDESDDSKEDSGEFVPPKENDSNSDSVVTH